jgi:hypothetical protein
MRPVTTQQWQDAVDAAHALLTLEHAHIYGLILGGPTVNVERCVELIEDGQTRGIRPRIETVSRLVAELPRVTTVCGICSTVCAPTCPNHR